GETEHAIAEWGRAGKMAAVRGAFKEALNSYQRALATLLLIPESPERDLRELRLREAVFLMHWMTKGPSSSDTLEEMQAVRALAEKSGNLASVVRSLTVAGMSALTSGDLRVVLRLANQVLEVALREGSPSSLLLAHSLQVQARQFRGD